jgi:hypothetical protein
MAKINLSDRIFAFVPITTQTILGSHTQGKANFMALGWLTQCNFKPPMTAIGTAADMNDWQAVKACFADEVLLDYTPMTGGEPTTLTPEQIVTAWRKFLPGFELTKHTITNHEVTIKGDAAKCLNKHLI